MDMQPQLASRTAPAGFAFNLPFAGQSTENQVDLGQQMMQLQQLTAMQQMQLAAFNEMQATIAAQNERLQAIAHETIQLATVRAVTAEEALTEKTQECLAKDAEIAMLKAQLASQEAAYATSEKAAKQALATQTKAMEAIKEQNAVLANAFSTTEKVMNDIEKGRHPSMPTYVSWRVYIPAFETLASQLTETREQLQKNIRNQTEET